MTEKLKKLISLAITDGVISDKERDILLKKATEEGIDLDEFEMELDAKLFERQQELKAQTASQITPPPAPEKPKSNKEGDVKKCPSCGAATQSFQANCSACGFEFRGTTKNRLLSQLEVELVDKNPKQKAAIVQKLVVPSNKEDLIEVLAYTSGKVFSYSGIDSEEDYFVDACRGKSLEIITKLKFFKNLEPPIQNQIMDIEKRLYKQKKNQTLKTIGFYIGIVALLFVSYYGIYLFIKGFL